MNEFIVWSETHIKFFDVASIYFDDGIPNQIDFVDDGETYFDSFTPQYGYIEKEECELFNYIGKTDIEGNKIYADSSIVRFVMSGSKKNFTATGYFFFHAYKLSYEFRCLMLDNKKLDYERNDINWRHMLSNSLKIIGNLQENKEIL